MSSRSSSLNHRGSSSSLLKSLSSFGLDALEFPAGARPRVKGCNAVEVGRIYRALDTVTVRVEASLESSVLSELAKGDLVKAMSPVRPEDGRFQVLLPGDKKDPMKRPGGRDGRFQVGWASAFTRKHKTTLFAEVTESDGLNNICHGSSFSEPLEYYSAETLLERFPSDEKLKVLLQLEKEAEKNHGNQIKEEEEQRKILEEEAALQDPALGELTIGADEEEAPLNPISSGSLAPAGGVRKVSSGRWVRKLNSSARKQGRTTPRQAEPDFLDDDEVSLLFLEEGCRAAEVNGHAATPKASCL